MKYIIEHMDKRLYKWCLLEYADISKTVGKKDLLFTNVKNPVKLNPIAKSTVKKVSELNLKNALVLDPFAKEELKTSDFKKYDYLIIGGVLGDHPMKKRTKKELTQPLGFDSRHLGRKQMSTNTAVLVAKMIENGKKLDRIRYKDGLKIKMGDYSEILLPYRYVVKDGEVVVPEGFYEFLKKRKSF